MSSLDTYIDALRSARVRVSARTREQRRLGELGLPEVCDLADMARALQLCTETLRRRCARGDIRGAYLEGGRWHIRRDHLLAYARALAA